MSEYTFHRISEALLPEFTSLYNEVFNQNFDISFFKNKFNTNWTGISYIGFLALDKNNAPAAYYGVYPYFFKLNNSVFIGAQIADNMTHPTHQKKGLFKTLMDLTCNLCKELGIVYIYGFPNHNSLPLYKKFNWMIEGNLITHSIKANPSFSAKILRRISKSIYLRFINNCIKNAGGGPIKQFYCTEFGDFQILRDRGYLDYKANASIFDISNGTYHCIIKANSFQLIIGDFQNLMDKNLIDKLLVLANKIGVDEIVLDLSQNFENKYIELLQFTKNEGRPIISKWLTTAISSQQKISLTGLDIDTF